MDEHDAHAAQGRPAEDAAAEPAASRWEDYVDVFLSPAELFRRRATDRVAPPLITLLALALLFYFVLLPANRLVMQASMADNPDALAAMERFGMLFQVIGSVFVPITYAAMIAFAAALLWLCGRFADVRIEFSRAMLVATYGGFIYLLAQVAGSVAVMLHGEVGLDVVRHISFGPLRFIGSADTDPVVVALLRRFDLFTLWQAAVWGIGVSVIYRVSRVRGLGVALGAWLLMTVPAVLMALLGIGQTQSPGAG
ncbi:MAG TPA: YIP1 family protein [Longimicrobiales bacterium]|nr:YIP1 family protein [Longimicrobiales bacterium]